MAIITSAYETTLIYVFPQDAVTLYNVRQYLEEGTFIETQQAMKNFPEGKPPYGSVWKKLIVILCVHKASSFWHVREWSRSGLYVRLFSVYGRANKY